MMRRSLHIVLGVVFLLMAGCDNAIDPLVDDAPERYAVYGYLDMRKGVQTVRVEALRPTVFSDPRGLDGVEVRLTDDPMLPSEHYALQIQGVDAGRAVLRPGPGAEAVEVAFREPVSAITPGQAAVFYDRETVLGGGWLA